ncbi:MAG: hypothetical protein JNL82_15320 [Myxococcales bacterium]|nr:hypothetical protein [Myxococcales bacterium]
MRPWHGLVVAFCSACAADPDPGYFDTKYVRYVTDQSFAFCEGLASDTDRKIEYLLDQLKEPYLPEQAILYKWVVDRSKLACSESKNAIGCANFDGEDVRVTSIEPAVFHELAHAVHFYHLGMSHRLLTEGLASYQTEPGRGLDPDMPNSFAADIESMITLGAVPDLKSYDIAAHFVGVTVERFGIEAFKSFYLDIDRTSTLDDFRSTYEAHYGEAWSEALTLIASQQRTVYDDIECEGTAEIIGAEGLHRTITATCEDDNVTGPIRLGSVPAGELQIPVELTEGFYRFAFVHPGEPGDTAATFRGCFVGAKAPEAPIKRFTPSDDMKVLLATGRYLLSVRVPLTDGSPPIEVIVEPVD